MIMIQIIIGNSNKFVYFHKKMLVQLDDSNAVRTFKIYSLNY